MAQNRLKLTALVLLLSLVAGVLAQSRPAPPPGDEALIKEIAAYRNWTRVQEKPVVVLNPALYG
jgi:hypothetical protein